MDTAKSIEERKAELLDEIARKMKFLGTYRRGFKNLGNPNLSIEQLESNNWMLEQSVKVHSDPMFRRRWRAIHKNKMDPKYEPMINHFKSIASNKKKFKSRWLMRILIDHAKRYEVLLEYLQTTFVLTISRIVESKSIVNLAFAHDIYRKYFKKAELEYLLTKTPMAFTWGEKFAIKCLLQVSRMLTMPEDGEDLTLFENPRFYEGLKVWLEKPDDSLVTVKPPPFVKSFFGSNNKFYSACILDYGEVFFGHLLEDLLNDN